MNPVCSECRRTLSASAEVSAARSDSCQAGVRSAIEMLGKKQLANVLRLPCQRQYFLPETSWTSILGLSMGEDEINGGSRDLTSIGNGLTCFINRRIL